VSLLFLQVSQARLSVWRQVSQQVSQQVLQPA
jgi:hypothetical protein